MAARKVLSPHAGHRERLRERFRRAELAGMLDYEVMELLLTMLIPMRDVKGLAKRLLQEFGSVAEVLDAPPEALAEVPGLGEVSATNLKILRSLIPAYLEQKCRDGGDLLLQPELTEKFVRAKIGAWPHESYMLIYLNARQCMINYEILTEGTVDRVFFYKRNAVEAALRNQATAVILVHNHPSGECRPSREDIAATEMLCDALDAVGIKLNDHLIVSKDNCFSFAGHGILTKLREAAEKRKRKDTLL